jgi:hypothetical protein
MSGAKIYAARGGMGIGVGDGYGYGDKGGGIRAVDRVHGRVERVERCSS